MQDQVRQAIENITYETAKFPRADFEVIEENPGEAIPYLLKALRKALKEKEALDPRYMLHLYALYFLRDFKCQEAFPILLELGALPEKPSDYLFSDVFTEEYGSVLYHTYNGDLSLLERYLRRKGLFEFPQSHMLDVEAQLCLDGSVSEEHMKTILRELISGLESESYYTTRIAYVICRLHFYDMLPELKQLFEDNFVDETVYGGYADCIDIMFDYRERWKSWRGFIQNFDDAITEVGQWSMFEDDDDDMDGEHDESAANGAETPTGEKGISKGGDKRTDDKISEEDDDAWDDDDSDARLSEEMLMKLLRGEKMNMQPQRRSERKIGRNDPCPCGSGKKYKKCCMLRDQEMRTAGFESEAVQKKWLKDYPETGVEKVEGRIYLDDYFDEESREIDRLVYLALHPKRTLGFHMEDPKEVRRKKRAYLSAAFECFRKKAEREHIADEQEYDSKYMIHYRLRDWLPKVAQYLEENTDREKYDCVAVYCERFLGK